MGRNVWDGRGQIGSPDGETISNAEIKHFPFSRFLWDLEQATSLGKKNTQTKWIKDSSSSYFYT